MKHFNKIFIIFVDGSLHFYGFINIILCNRHQCDKPNIPYDDFRPIAEVLFTRFYNSCGELKITTSHVFGKMDKKTCQSPALSLGFDNGQRTKNEMAVHAEVFSLDVRQILGNQYDLLKSV